LEYLPKNVFLPVIFAGAVRCKREPMSLKGAQAALIDFAYNCDAGNLQASTLRKAVYLGDFGSAAEQFPKWVYARGIKLSGLVRRRNAERELF